MCISEGQAEYALEVASTLEAAGLRVEVDLRAEKISYKIREHTLQKVPYLLVVGDREKEQGQVAVRTRGGEDLGSMPVEAFLAKLRAETSPAA